MFQTVTNHRVLVAEGMELAEKMAGMGKSDKEATLRKIRKIEKITGQELVGNYNGGNA